MPYQIDRHAHDMLWVTLHGYLAMDHAEHYFQEMWRTLDGCPRPTNLLVDGRHIQGGSHSARQRTEQIVHHPHLGHIAFVVSAHHLLIFAPLVHLVSGIGLFGDEHEAVAFLRNSADTPTIASGNLTKMTPRPDQGQHSAPPPPPQGGLLGMLDSWSNGLRQLSRQIERD